MNAEAHISEILDWDHDSNLSS